MLLRLEGEGVHVDTNGRDVGVVLVRLHQVEVLALTLRETIVTVELDLGGYNGVLTGFTDGADGISRAIIPVRVVEGLVTRDGRTTDSDRTRRAIEAGIIAAVNERVTLDNPHEFLGGVVEVHLDLVGRRSDGFTTSELELLDEVLVGDLGETTTLIRIEVDVVYVEGGGDETGGGNAGADIGDTGAGSGLPAEVAELVELEPDLDLVVLEGDEGESKTRVAAEPELEGHVESVLRGTLAAVVRAGKGLTGSAVGITAIRAGLGDLAGELRDVTDHLGVTGLLTSLLRELIPDVEPVTVVLIDLLTTDLDVHVVDEVVTNPLEPTELGRSTIAAYINLGEGGLEVDTVDQVTVTGDGALHLLTEVGGAVERLFNGFHGEVGVATVNDLEEGDLRIASKVDILRAVSDELH